MSYEELYSEFLEIVSTGNAQKARSYLVKNLDSLREEDREKILRAFSIEAL